VRSRWIDGPVGRLDSRWHGPEGGKGGKAAVLLHPHPRFGGTMGSRFVYETAQALAEAGWLAVRCDFRGVGRSDGGYGWGEGEAEDAAAVVAAVEQETGRVPAVVGHSFGGAAALRLAATRELPAVVAVGVPHDVTESRLVPYEDAKASRAMEHHLIVGDQDPYVTPEQAYTLATAFPRAATVTVLGGIGHLLAPVELPRGVQAVLQALHVG